MSGEIPEEHKRDLERSRETIRKKSAEIVDLQQQLAKLSTIVDNKSSMGKQAEGEIRFVPLKHGQAQMMG